MEDLHKEYTLSLYNNLTSLNNSPKSNVYLAKNQINGKVFIKKELKTYNMDVYDALRTINHKNTPKVFEAIELDGTLTVIEEFINGFTLQEILDIEGPLEEERVISYTIDLCNILGVLHNRTSPIIHRDIKPSNVIISNDDVLKLIDFDVSRIYREDGERDTQVLGTKGYASPEQFGFDQTDCRSDIYSLGILMNVLLTGKHPKEEKSLGKLSSIIEKCTYIAAEKRYDNVNILRNELSYVLDSNSVKAVEDTYLYEETLDKDDETYDIISETYHISDEPLEKKKKLTKFSKIIGVLKEMPGFRSKSIVKMILATLWYLFLIIGLCTTFEEFSIANLLENISMVSMLFSMTLLNANFKNIKNKLPLLNSSDKLQVKSGLIVYNFILFMIGGGLLSYFQSL